MCCKNMVAQVRTNATYGDVFFFYLLPEPQRGELGIRHLGVAPFVEKLDREIVDLEDLLTPEQPSLTKAEHSLMARIRRVNYHNMLYSVNPSEMEKKLRSYYDYLFHLRYSGILEEHSEE